MSAAHRDRPRGPLSETHRANLSAAKTGVARPDMLGDNNPAKRPEVRAKISAAVRARHAR